MPIPPFDQVSGCLPAEPRLHDCDIEEMQERFVKRAPKSTRRPLIFAAWTQHALDWQAIVGPQQREQWVNGSFVTAKAEPGDIDILTVFPHTLINDLSDHEMSLIDALFPGSPKPTGALVHAFAVASYPDGHPLKEEEEEWRDYWLNEAFGKNHDTNELKGVLRIMVGGDQ